MKFDKAKLVEAFKAAKAAAEKVKDTEDGGTCNFDSPFLRSEIQNGGGGGSGSRGDIGPWGVFRQEGVLPERDGRAGQPAHEDGSGSQEGFAGTRFGGQLVFDGRLSGILSS